VADTLYSDMENIIVDSPEAWKLDSKVNITVFKKNYRLQSKNFDGYDDEYYEDLIDGAIFSDDYSGYLKYALEHNWLITTPTKARGNEINEILTKEFKSAKDVAPFIIVNDDYYLNPFNKHYSELQEAFDFLPEINIESLTEYKLSAYMSTHRVQSFTVDNVLFYLGNNPIGNRHKSHYSNNLLYTAISRARFDVQILGLPESFQQMHKTMPLTAQQKNVHLKAGIAIVNLKKWVGEADYTPLADEIYDKYVDLYNDNSLLSAYEKSLLEIYKIDSKMHNKRYVIDYINNNFSDKFGFTLTVWLKENASEAKKAPRRGKVKQWIDSLSDDELEVVKQDVEDLSLRKFKAKYSYDHRSVQSLTK
ncbi:C-terminal helicase domain-containing protein, partial [Leuconostoc citreum]|uniref:C-terminal helicase domain-containing protein n=1 Tax=Leuconostoc citreum TaxID=33964 RepID=UPI0021A883CA